MMFSKLEVTVEEINKDVPLHNKEKLALRTHISIESNIKTAFKIIHDGDYSDV